MKTFLTAAAALVLMLGAQETRSHEFLGSVSSTYRHYFEHPLFDGQSRDDLFFSFEPEYTSQPADRIRLVVAPVFRADGAGDPSDDWDIGQVDLLYLDESWSLRVGSGKVFWGATEFVHLVDVINQTDLRYRPDGEEKLGQPMVNVTWYHERWSVEAYLLPMFRERRFPGVEDRLRPAVLINVGNAEYESRDRERHIDQALRINYSANDADIGIYHFRGTCREPVMIPRMDPSARLKLVPYYCQMDQIGIDLQWSLGTWLLKSEMLYRDWAGDDFLAAVVALEYTLFDVWNTNVDLTLIGEYSWDQRESPLNSIYQNDIVTGFRLAFNDLASTEILAGVSHDLNVNSNVVSLEFSRRLNERLSIEAEARCFLELSEKDMVYDCRNDAYVQFSLIYYF